MVRRGVSPRQKAFHVRMLPTRFWLAREQQRGRKIRPLTANHSALQGRESQSFSVFVGLKFDISTFAKIVWTKLQILGQIFVGLFSRHLLPQKGPEKYGQRKNDQQAAQQTLVCRIGVSNEPIKDACAHQPHNGWHQRRYHSLVEIALTREPSHQKTNNRKANRRKDMLPPANFDDHLVFGPRRSCSATLGLPMPPHRQVGSDSTMGSLVALRDWGFKKEGFSLSSGHLSTHKAPEPFSTTHFLKSVKSAASTLSTLCASTPQTIALKCSTVRLERTTRHGNLIRLSPIKDRW